MFSTGKVHPASTKRVVLFLRAGEDWSEQTSIRPGLALYLFFWLVKK